MTSFVGSMLNSLTHLGGTQDAPSSPPESGKEKINAGLRHQDIKHASAQQGFQGSNPGRVNQDSQQKAKEPAQKLDVSHLTLDPVSEVEQDVEIMSPTTALPLDAPICRESRRLSEYPSPWPTFNTALDEPTLTREVFTEKVSSIIEELFVSWAVEDNAHSVKSLGCESLHDVMLQKVILMGMERGADTFHIVASFVSELTAMEVVNQPQLLRTLHAFASSIPDLQLDMPLVEVYLYEMIRGFVDKKLLDNTVFCQFPEQILRAGKVEPHLTNLRVFKKQIKPILETYFHTNDFSVLNEAVQRLDMPQCHHELMKSACMMAFDRHERDRSLLPSLLADAHSENLLDAGDLELGFSALIGCLDDGSLDCPDMATYLIELMTSAVVDELVSSDLLHRQLRLGFGGVRGCNVYACVLRRTPEHSRKVWGEGGMAQLNAEMDHTISEFFHSHEFKEVGNILGELHLSKSQEALFLRKLMTEGMLRGREDLVIELTKHLLDVYWTPKDVAVAMEALRAHSHDLVLDIPHVRRSTTQMIDECVSVGALDSHFRFLDALDVV